VINRFVLWLLLVGSVFFSLPPAFAAEKVSGPRVALIIGNSAYTNFPALRNPVHDAKAVDERLKQLGFETSLLLDADQISMESAIERFGALLKKGGVGLFYYAGHGIQYQSQNYLIPANAEIKSSKNLRYKSVNLGQVLDTMENSNSDINIVVIDACRNNPLPSEKRSAMRGLARVDSPKGTLIAYATSPGKTAEDGDGNNGTYTKYFLKALQIPNIPIEVTFRRVREGVDKETRGTQTPWESSSIVGDFIINPSSSDEKSIHTKIPANTDTAESKLEAEKARLQSLLNNQQVTTDADQNQSVEVSCNETRSLASTCLDLGDTYMTPGSKYNPKLGMNAYRRACDDKDNMVGCEKLGLAYASKHGAWDFDNAQKYLRRACDAGMDDSCEQSKLINMLISNEKACKNGQYDSCALLGEVFTVNEPPPNFAAKTLADKLRHFVKADNKVAYNYLNKACNGDKNYNACFLLANRYRLGQGTNKDYARALGFYQQYCSGEFEDKQNSKKNDYLSCYYIGEMYAKGMGVTVDKDKAYKYYDLACNEKQGADVGCEAIAGLKQ